MRKNINSLSALATGLLITLFVSSCRKEDHQVRFKNDYGATFLSVAIDEVQFTNVGSGMTTDYTPIIPGDFKITGTTADNKALSGNGSVSGKGKHRWTITANADGVSIKED